MQKKVIKSFGAVGLLAILAPAVFASGFQTSETNGSGLGNAYAGGAAVAADAGSEFDNPAGMVRLKSTELDASGVAVIAHGNFKVDSMSNIMHFNGLPLLAKNTGNNPVNPLDTNYLPSVHLVAPINERFFFGFGATVPFGYSTDYGENSLSSNFGTKSYIKTINLNPSLAFKINNHFSVGLGFDAQYLKAELNRTFVALPTFLIPQILSVATNSRIFTTADDWAYGWNAGLLYQYDDATRFGLSYRSSIRHTPTGDMKLKGSAEIATPLIPIPPINVNLGWDAETTINLPETVLLSGYHDFNQHVAAMASIEYTHWSRFDQLNLHFTNGTSLVSVLNMNMKENFRNTFRYSLGGNYRFNENWMWRVGAAYDQSPVTDSNRTIPLPDGDRTWLATGLQYTFNKYFTADAGYAHIFIKNGTVNNVDPIAGNITGHYNDNHANLLGIQLAVKFN